MAGGVGGDHLLQKHLGVFAVDGVQQLLGAEKQLVHVGFRGAGCKAAAALPGDFPGGVGLAGIGRGQAVLHCGLDGGIVKAVAGDGAPALVLDGHQGQGMVQGGAQQGELAAVHGELASAAGGGGDAGVGDAGDGEQVQGRLGG